MVQCKKVIQPHKRAANLLFDESSVGSIRDSKSFSFEFHAWICKLSMEPSTLLRGSFAPLAELLRTSNHQRSDNLALSFRCYVNLCGSSALFQSDSPWGSQSNLVHSNNPGFWLYWLIFALGTSVSCQFVIEPGVWGKVRHLNGSTCDFRSLSWLSALCKLSCIASLT